MKNIENHMLDMYDPSIDEPENECRYCGIPCEKMFCSKECFEADLHD